jgi:hypothetical protein
LFQKYGSSDTAHQKAHRVDDYYTWPAIPDGNTFFVWTDDIADYATVYLFFQWLRIHSGSSQIYKDILQAQRQGNGSDLDYRVVLKAAQQRFGSNTSHASNWETFLRSWLAANCLNAPNGIFGSGGELMPQPRFASSGGTVPLKPGEGIYSDLAGTQNPSASGNIKYAGLNKSAKTVSISGSYSTGEWLLTFNSNDNNKSFSPENGTVYASAAPAAAMRAVPEAAVSQEPRRIGVTELLGGQWLNSVPPVDAQGRNLAGFLIDDEQE